jgi:hypothetical protein
MAEALERRNAASDGSVVEISAVGKRPRVESGRIAERVRGRTKKRRIPGVKAAGDTIQGTNRRQGNACD